MLLSEVVREMGFESVEEFHRLVAQAPTDTPARLARFLAWRNDDGTKTGLAELHILAASRDLFEALVALIEPCECYSRERGEHGYLCRKAQAALAKARGETAR